MGIILWRSHVNGKDMLLVSGFSVEKLPYLGARISCREGDDPRRLVLWNVVKYSQKPCLEFLQVRKVSLMDSTPVCPCCPLALELTLLWVYISLDLFSICKFYIMERKCLDLSPLFNPTSWVWIFVASIFLDTTDTLPKITLFSQDLW